jgi:ligand-binding sensor protein
VKDTEEILMKIDFIEKTIKFASQRNQDSWQREKEYMDYLQNLAVLEQNGRQSTEILDNISIYETLHTARVAFENRNPGYGI